MIQKNTWVKVTKTHAFSFSKVPVGASSVGSLKFDVKKGSQILLEAGQYLQSSHIENVTMTKGNDFLVTTKTSVYFIQVLN